MSTAVKDYHTPPGVPPCTVLLLTTRVQATRRTRRQHAQAVEVMAMSASHSSGRAPCVLSAAAACVPLLDL